MTVPHITASRHRRRNISTAARDRPPPSRNHSRRNPFPRPPPGNRAGPPPANKRTAYAHPGTVRQPAPAMLRFGRAPLPTGNGSRAGISRRQTPRYANIRLQPSAALL